MSIDHYPKPEVGMDVFVVTTAYRTLRTTTATIVKVGRKWATLNGCIGRFDITTWRLDGGNYSSPGTCYPSEQEYLAQQELIKSWSEFKKKVHCMWLHHSVTVEKIRQAAELLGMELL